MTQQPYCERVFFVFGDGEDSWASCFRVPVPRVGDVVRFYVDAYHGRSDVEDAPEHLATDGIPWRVVSVEWAVSLNYRGEHRMEATVRMVRHTQGEQ
jgi:hypothetical protein